MAGSKLVRWAAIEACQLRPDHHRGQRPDPVVRGLQRSAGGLAATDGVEPAASSQAWSGELGRPA
jgi:hypothetical protein